MPNFLRQGKSSGSTFLLSKGSELANNVMHFVIPVNRIVDSLICSWLNIPVRFAYADNFGNFPAEMIIMSSGGMISAERVYARHIV
jgi:hypothetical protein